MEFVRIDGFEQVINCAETECPDGIFLVGGCKNNPKIDLFEAGKEIETAFAGHLNVQEDQVRPLLPDQFDARIGIPCFTAHFDLGTHDPDQVSECLPGIGFVVDNDSA
ncbi:hypothetical protein D3C87_1894270 [compost metagenome]